MSFREFIIFLSENQILFLMRKIKRIPHKLEGEASSNGPSNRGKVELTLKLDELL